MFLFYFYIEYQKLLKHIDGTCVYDNHNSLYGMAGVNTALQSQYM